MTHDPMHEAETDAIVAAYDRPGRAVPGAVEAMATLPREPCYGAAYEPLAAEAAR
jgi:hypothetical protein